MFKIWICLFLSVISLSQLFSEIEDNKKNDASFHEFFWDFDFNHDWSYLSDQAGLKTLFVNRANNTNLPDLLINAAESSSLTKIQLDFFLFATVYEDIDKLNFSVASDTFPIAIKNLILNLGNNNELEELDIIVLLSHASAEVKEDYKQLENDYKILHPKTKTNIRAITHVNPPSGG